MQTKIFNRFRPNLEALEDRLVPADYYWINNGGSLWGDYTNWKVGDHTTPATQVPGVQDRVIFGDDPWTGTTCVINGDVVVKSVVNSGSFGNYTGNLIINGSLNVWDGNSSWIGGGIYSANSGSEFIVSDGVTMNFLGRLPGFNQGDSLAGEPGDLYISDGSTVNVVYADEGTSWNIRVGYHPDNGESEGFLTVSGSISDSLNLHDGASIYVNADSEVYVNDANLTDVDDYVDSTIVNYGYLQIASDPETMDTVLIRDQIYNHGTIKVLGYNSSIFDVKFTTDGNYDYSVLNLNGSYFYALDDLDAVTAGLYPSAGSRLRFDDGMYSEFAEVFFASSYLFDDPETDGYIDGRIFVTAEKLDFYDYSVVYNYSHVFVTGTVGVYDHSSVINYVDGNYEDAILVGLWKRSSYMEVEYLDTDLADYCTIALVMAGETWYEDDDTLNVFTYGALIDDWFYAGSNPGFSTSWDSTTLQYTIE